MLDVLGLEIPTPQLDCFQNSVWHGVAPCFIPVWAKGMVSRANVIAVLSGARALADSLHRECEDLSIRANEGLSSIFLEEPARRVLVSRATPHSVPSRALARQRGPLGLMNE